MDVSGVGTGRERPVSRPKEAYDTEAASDFSQNLQRAAANAGGGDASKINLSAQDNASSISSLHGASPESMPPAHTMADSLLAQSRVQEVSQQISNSMAKRFASGFLSADFTQTPLAYAGLLSNSLNNANLLTQSYAPVVRNLSTVAPRSSGPADVRSVGAVDGGHSI